ncbi:hypothetical protein [Streptomyces sp. NPDC059783]|uniref:hypothetical protein n=1 Tax=Streptomyces sp. NPDC059783 TaxID=3346944 RepID=UPI00365F5F1D
MSTWPAGVALLIYLAGASAISYALGRYWWPALRSEDTALDRITSTHPLTTALLLAAVAIAWPITIPLGYALHNNAKNGNPT